MSNCFQFQTDEFARFCDSQGRHWSVKTSQKEMLQFVQQVKLFEDAFVTKYMLGKSLFDGKIQISFSITS